MISSIVNVSIVIVELCKNDSILYPLEIIIQFLDVISIPVLILLFSFGKKKLQYFKEIICCIKDEEKTETKTNKTNESVVLLLMNQICFKILSATVLIQIDI